MTGSLLSQEIIPLTLEYAVHDFERAKGLMQRDYLPPNQGMLFKYPYPQKVSIWMYNTLIDLSVAFLDHDKVIREIHELKAYPEIKEPSFFHQKSTTSSFKASFALEMNKDWFKKNGIKPGDQLVLEGFSNEAKIIKKQ